MYAYMHAYTQLKQVTTKVRSSRPVSRGMSTVNSAAGRCNLVIFSVSLCYLAAGDDAVKWRETYMDNIAKMLLSSQQTKPDQFITCVHRLHLHFPPIADK